MKEIDLSKEYQFFDPPVEMWVWDCFKQNGKNKMVYAIDHRRQSPIITKDSFYENAELIKPEYMTNDEMREFCENNPVAIAEKDEDRYYRISSEFNLKSISNLIEIEGLYFKIWENGKWSEPREFLREYLK